MSEIPTPYHVDSYNRLKDVNTMSKPEANVLSIQKLVANDRLKIPDYQRPYKWTVTNVNQFINDLLQHSDKDQYRIGNMVVHANDDGMYDIVDGQQRFMTILLILKAIHSHQSESLTNIWPKVDKYLSSKGKKFSNPITRYNLIENYQAIQQQKADLYRVRTFITSRVEIVQFILSNQSEAFQFFDSQNARGRELYPHDLLKAFHLREFPEDEEHLKVDVVEVWEDMESKDLAELFEHYLYRIRAWSKGQKTWYFSKNEVNWFKGVNIDKAEDYPFINTYRLMHNRIDDITKDMPTYFGSRKYVFPFQLDQVILNGRRFFEMISVYKKLIDSVEEEDFAKKVIDPTANKILKTIRSYKGHKRTGDKYVRNLFMASLIYYIDKFGSHGLSDAIKRLFVWSYRIRLEMHAVRVETIANHAEAGFSNEGSNNAFRVIGDAIHHTEIRKLVNRSIENPKRDIPDLKELMEDLGIKIGGLSG